MAALHQIIHRFKRLPELKVNFIHFSDKFLSLFKEKSEEFAHGSPLFNFLSLTCLIYQFVVRYVIYLYVKHIDQLLDKRLRVYFGE